MALHYLKKSMKKSDTEISDVRILVQSILDDIEVRRETAALEYANKFDKYGGNVQLTSAEIEVACGLVPQKLKDDINFAHDNVRLFAEQQMKSLHDLEFEVQPGFKTGQKSIPIKSAGCYVPGGRYSHVASAIMTVTTAKVAGVKSISVCSPPSPDIGISPGIIYTANLCGADRIYALGGVQGIASMAFGLFDQPNADILVGPGNQFVAEAKRILFGRVGIDMFAGPTDSLILADKSADPEIVAVDLVGQAEHGYNSPVWLITDSENLAKNVLARVPELIDQLPTINRESALAAWRDYAEIILCANREEMASISDNYAPEHLTVQAEDLDWWLSRLECYGSLFLGEETTVAYGDKASGTNHVLPTSGAAKYTGGLSVHKFLKIVTWQRSSRQGAKSIAEATARISRLEGMEAVSYTHLRAHETREDLVCRLRR